jgi:superfamily I DNA/RNA helicase
MLTTEHQQTEEQKHILERAVSNTDNLMLNALAGCGKTTTLEMIEREVDTKPILYLCFNKKNADEATDRMLSTTTVRTFNSLGHRIWAKACAKSSLSLNPRKSQEILREIIQAVPKRDQGPIWEVFWDVVGAVGLAKAMGYVPEGVFPTARRLCTQGSFHSALDEPPDDLVSDLIDAVLTRSIKQSYAGTIDYNDQIYMPALFGGAFPRFPLVKVDEYQDLNPTNHAMLDKLVKHRLIGVGDPWQNIYGFRGAKAEGMAEAQANFKMTPCNLSTSFRCPSEIVKHVHWRVPHFKWIREGGSVEQATKIPGSSISDNAAIICRNNAPLFRLALSLLSHKRSVSVAGSDVGPKLLAMMKKLGAEDAPQASFLSAIEDWRAEKLAKGNASASDLADCMKVFAGFGSTKSQAISYAEHLFAQKGSIRLLTGHKSKGLEFDTVYHLDPWLLSDTEQDKNLRYVISTRSRDRLIEIDSRNIQW